MRPSLCLAPRDLTKVFRRGYVIIMLLLRKIVPKYDNSVLQTKFWQNPSFLTHFSQNIAENDVESMADSPRFNPVNIQMLSNSLKKQIFGDVTPEYDTKNVSRMVEHLKRHELWNNETSELAKQLHLKLPNLYGDNLDEHFREIAVRQSCEYRDNAQVIAQCCMPKTPKKWVFQPGWVKYNEDGNAESVDFPDEMALVFDVEVCVKEGPTPILATAVSKDCWYSWCSDALIEDHFNHGQKITTQNLINLETKLCENNPPQGEWKKRLIIGHNVSYDRARIKEQYYIQGSKMRFLDTMSLHIAIAGLTGLQRALLMAEKTGSKRKSVNAASNNHRGPPVKDWMQVGSVNNLADVYKLHCGKKLNKEPRKIFVTGKIGDVRASFQDLMAYCAEDVKATRAVLKVLLPQFFQRFPHPVTFAGMLELSVAYLPVNHNWERYLRESQATYDDLEQELKMMLMHLANEACELFHNEEYKKDPWLWDLDWSVKEIRSKKIPPPSTRKRKLKTADENITTVKELTEIEESEQLVNKVLDSVKHLYVRRPHMAGYPTWFRSLCPKPKPGDPSDEYGSGPSLISTQMQVTPKLLRLTWEGYPMHYSEVHGWGYLVPETNKINLPVGDKKFPFHSVLKLCTTKVIESDVDEKQVDMDELWEQLAEGIMDQREEALFWNLIKGDKDNGQKDGKASNPMSLGPFWEADTPGCLFYKLPHKNGPENRVGNPLAKDFLAKIEDGAIRASSGAKADRALKLSKMMSYWRNANERIKSQMVVCLNKCELQDTSINNDFLDGNETFYGAILPQIVTAGTVTRRAVEATWLTASNAYEDRVGSELKAMIQAFPGYHFVGADVDSQELWIAAILGDSTYGGVHGCTAFGWMTLQGKKSNGTDMHSKTAAAVGISRDQAKVLNYGRIYGAGQTFTSRLLMQYNHKLTVDEAKAKSHLIYSTTKGVRGYLLNQTGKKIWEKYYDNNKNKSAALSADKLDAAEVLGISANGEEIILSRSHILNLLKLSGRKFELWDLVEKPVWIGGTESPMFNKLEEIALSSQPKTPVLSGRITRALEPQVVLYNFMTSRVNWVVQSSAVDYLHLMLVSMRWLLEEYNMKGRFSISIHDEVRYLVKSEDRYRVALALQVTNLLTRALFAWKLDMMDLPHCVAFFSSVDIDTVIRKEVNLDCKTPSNPHGLQNGYKIPPGKAVDINEVLKITNGLLTKPGNEKLQLVK